MPPSARPHVYKYITRLPLLMTSPSYPVTTAPLLLLLLYIPPDLTVPVLKEGKALLGLLLLPETLQVLTAPAVARHAL